MVLRDKMAPAYNKRDAAGFENAAKDFMMLGRDIDSFLGARREFMLGKWIRDARSWAANDAGKTCYEKNARTFLTIWGGNRDLLDYAHRQWNGRMRDYYLPQWKMFIEATPAELGEGKAVARAAFEKAGGEREKQFATTAGGNYVHQPRPTASL